MARGPQGQLTAGCRQDRPSAVPGPPGVGARPARRQVCQRVRSIELLKHNFEALEIGSNVQVSLFERRPPGAVTGTPAPSRTAAKRGRAGSALTDLLASLVT